MKDSVKNLELDALLMLAPGVSSPQEELWPSPVIEKFGRALSGLGCRVGWAGVQGVSALGVLPNPHQSGGRVVLQDLQGRVHQVSARAIVRFRLPEEICAPFRGFSEVAVLPESSFRRLYQESDLSWSGDYAILGGSPRAFEVGCRLLEGQRLDGTHRGRARDEATRRPRLPARSVAIVIPSAWSSALQEVWRVRFLSLGGTMILGSPKELRSQGSARWILKVEDARGVRVMELDRLITVGPFGGPEDFEPREYPEGSLLFEVLLESLYGARSDLLESQMELEWSRVQEVLQRVVRTLSLERRGVRDRKTDTKLRDGESQQVWEFEGKWLTRSSREKLRSWGGAPPESELQTAKASIECFQDIPCQTCAKECPEEAIKFQIPREGSDKTTSVLVVDRCTGCGVCLDVCPSATPVLLHAPVESSSAKMTLSHRSAHSWKKDSKNQNFGVGVNRRGESMGLVRVLGVHRVDHSGAERMEVELPKHLLWEVRGVRRPDEEAAVEAAYVHWKEFKLSERVGVSLQGERRLLRSDVPLSIALFETGLARPGNRLLCRDDSCRRCEVRVDGQSSLACKEHVRAGMTIEFPSAEFPDSEVLMCSCLGISLQAVETQLRLILRSSPDIDLDSWISRMGLGVGKCHGTQCLASFRDWLSREVERLRTSARLPEAKIEGVLRSKRNWVNWQFPMRDWKVPPFPE